MLNYLKRKVRTWEAEGRNAPISRFLTMIWVAGHNALDFLYSGHLKRDRIAHQLSKDVKTAVEQVMEGDLGRSVRPMQVREELEALITLVDRLKPRRLVEIGTARGGTLLLLCRFAAPDATIVSIDLPYGRNGGGYPRWKERIYEGFARSDQKLHLLRANSHDPATVERAKGLLTDEQADFILIDADHSYEGVKTDFENFSAIIASGGVVALHDILENKHDPSIDVERFWRELEQQSVEKTTTIVHDPEQGAYGIGLVHFK